MTQKTSEISQSEQMMPMLSHIDQAFANSNLRGPPAHYLAQLSANLPQPEGTSV